MAIEKVFKRVYRPYSKEHLKVGCVHPTYVETHFYAEKPFLNIRAFMLIQRDILSLFDFIEPGDKNEETYSLRIHELLLRVCSEVEANFKAILKANNYSRKGRWNMDRDYGLLEVSSKLSEYQVIFPYWRGDHDTVCPFSSWKFNKNERNDDGTIRGYEPLDWFKAYNDVKHDRNNKFEKANLKNLLLAFSGLAVLNASQFKNESFSSIDSGISSESSDRWGDFTESIGGYLRIKWPEWEEDEKYEFQNPKKRLIDFTVDDFQNFPFNASRSG